MLLLQQLKDISCQLGQQQQSCSSKAAAAGLLLWAWAYAGKAWDRQIDGWTP